MKIDLSNVSAEELSHVPAFVKALRAQEQFLTTICQCSNAYLHYGVCAEQDPCVLCQLKEIADQPKIS